LMSTTIFGIGLRRPPVLVTCIGGRTISSGRTSM
jgi:hypothetical protein